jgi:hypothetical protein
MSNGPTRLGSKFKPMRKINVQIDKKHWCVYKGECKEYLNISTLCWNCMWMQKFDIPALVEGEIKNDKRMDDRLGEL